MSVTAIGRWAAPITSRITPPTPVFEPPKGSIAEGWLWVSAFTASVRARGERDDAGVADERAAQERRVDGVGGGAQLLQQRSDRRGPSHGGDPRPERLVGAVLAPRLGEGLQLDIGGGPAGEAEVIGDGVQLGEVERQAALAVERQQRVVVEAVEVDQLDVAVGDGFGVDERRLDRPDRPPFDHLVGQQPPGDCRRGSGRRSSPWSS